MPSQLTSVDRVVEQRDEIGRAASASGSSSSRACSLRIEQVVVSHDRENPISKGQSRRVYRRSRRGPFATLSRPSATPAQCGRPCSSAASSAVIDRARIATAPSRRVVGFESAALFSGIGQFDVAVCQLDVAEEHFEAVGDACSGQRRANAAWLAG